MKSELDLFAKKPVQVSILKTQELVLKPISSLDNTSVIEFVSLGRAQDYRDLSSVYIRLRVQLMKDLKDTLHTTGDSGVVNNLLHSLFRQVTVYLNGKSVAQNDMNYFYRAYLENLLNYGTESASTHLDGDGWMLDKDKVDSLIAKENPGLDARKALYGKSDVIELMGKIHCDLFNQPKLLLNNVDLRIVMALEKPEFYVLEPAAKTSYIKILDASLYINHCVLNPNILIAHNNVLQRQHAIYFYKQVEVRSFTISQNNYNISLDNVSIGKIPNLIIVGFVDNDAYVGNREKNPYNFQHYDLTQFNLTVNGVSIPSQPIEFDFSKKPSICSRGYLTLFRGTNTHMFDKAHQINKAAFENGSFLLCFDLSADNSNGLACDHLLNQGIVGIEGRFKNALAKTITCIAYAEYDNVIEIDKSRNVYNNY